MIEAAPTVYAERFGVSDAAKERGLLSIGNVIDTQADYPETVIASALWHFEPTLNAAIAAVKGNTFKADDYGPLSYLKTAGSISPIGTRSKVAAETIALKVEAKGRDHGRQPQGGRRVQRAEPT